MQNIKQLVLETLAICRRAGRTMSRRALHRECELEHLGVGSIGDGEFDDALNDLEARRMVSHEVHPLTGDRQYSITDEGLRFT